MTCRKELETLIAKAEALGASVTVVYDSEGWIETVQVRGLGCGTFPMSPIYAAARLRELVN